LGHGKRAEILVSTLFWGLKFGLVEARIEWRFRQCLVEIASVWLEFVMFS